jgi:Uma2 family endonuclease
MPEMTTGLITSEAALTASPPERLFTVEEYYRMAEAGILHPDERVELIEGRILKMYRKTPLHSACTTRINYWLLNRLDDQAEIRVHNPVDLDEFTEPEPDLILAKLDEDEYVDHHPLPSELFLIIEIADLSLEYDREVKTTLYAKAGVLQYCLVNLTNLQIEDHRNPIAGGYSQKQIYAGDQSFNLVAFPDVEIKAADWLMRRQH